MKVHIIGGGIIGFSTAYHLRNFCDVTIFEKDNSYSSSSFALAVVVLEVSFLHQNYVEMSRYSIEFIKIN